MSYDDSPTARYHNLQMIGLELGMQGGEEVSADTLYERILEADPEEGEEVFGLEPDRAERAFYRRGYDRSKKWG